MVTSVLAINEIANVQSDNSISQSTIRMNASEAASKQIPMEDLAFSGQPSGKRSDRWRRFVYFPTGSTVQVSVDFNLPIGTSGATVTVSPSITFTPTTIIGRYHHHRRISERIGMLNMATDAFSQ